MYGRPPHRELEPIPAELAAMERALGLAELGKEPASIARQLDLEGPPTGWG